MKLTLLTLVSLFSLTVPLPIARAGGDIGNGGGGFVCHDPRNLSVITEVVSGDLFRGRTELELSIPRDTTLSADQQARRALERLSRHVRPELSNKLFEIYSQLLDTLARPETFLEADLLIADLGQSKPRYGRIDCDFRYIIDYDNQGLVKAVSNFYQEMKMATDKAALHVHETIFKLARAFGAKDSEAVQFLTAYLFAETEYTLAISKLAEVLFTNGQPKAHVLGGCVKNHSIARMAEGVQNCSRQVEEAKQLPAPIMQHMLFTLEDLNEQFDVTSLLKGCGMSGSAEQRVADCRERLKDLPAIPEWFPPSFLKASPRGPRLFLGCGTQFGSSLEVRERDCEEKINFQKSLSPAVLRTYFKSSDPRKKPSKSIHVITVMHVQGHETVLWRDNDGELWTFSRRDVYDYKEAKSECERAHKVFQTEGRIFRLPLPREPEGWLDSFEDVWMGLGWRIDQLHEQHKATLGISRYRFYGSAHTTLDRYGYYSEETVNDITAVEMTPEPWTLYLGNTDIKNDHATFLACHSF